VSKQCVSYQDFSVAENLKTNFKVQTGVRDGIAQPV
jgi:hypothetical protein